MPEPLIALAQAIVGLAIFVGVMWVIGAEYWRRWRNYERYGHWSRRR